MENLRVWYGLRKLTPTVVKKPSIIVAFENGYLWKNENSIKRMMKILHCRFQTEQELEDCNMSSRVFSIWEIYLNDKKFNGDIERAIEFNYQCDSNNVSEQERIEIANKIRNEIYDFYNIKPKNKVQMELFG